ncbi:hypothetical protein ACIOUE_03655 [Streptomyces xanthochromogenes]|uniref:hypothetical protein n=1 Tax=Streptomyces xanthochromogenes TaxID=67384 RepID=UPI0038233E1C
MHAGRAEPEGHHGDVEDDDLQVRLHLDDPPASITGAEKTTNAKSYGYTGSLHDAEYDHLVSLELGGDPNDPRNLWVEPPSPGHKSGAGPNNPKDSVESKLHTAICSGKTQLAAAQNAIATDWPNALAKLGLS